MGCWGITAFESDAGLDAVGFIREMMLKDGRMELGEIIKAIQKEEWYAPPEASDGVPHTSPMALAEIIVKFLDGDRDGTVSYTHLCRIEHIISDESFLRLKEAAAQEQD